MNKKFSTLVACLLFASAFSASAGTATSMLSTPVGVETRAIIGNSSAVTGGAGVNAGTIKAEGILNGFTSNSRLQVFSATGAASPLASPSDPALFVTLDGTTVGTEAAYDGTDAAQFYWKLAGDRIVDQNNKTLSLADEQNFDIVPLKNASGVTSFFALRIAGGTNNGKYITFTVGAGSGAAGTFAVGDDDATNAAIFASVEAAFSATATTGTDLNDKLNPGFNLSIASAKDGVAIDGAKMFDGKLTVMEYADDINAGASGTTVTPGFVPATASAADYLLGTSDGKLIYFDATAKVGSEQTGAFKTISHEDALKNDTYKGDEFKFNVYASDNGSAALKVTVGKTSPAVQRLYIHSTGKTGYLTAKEEAGVTDASAWAVTTLGSANTLDFKTLLTGQFIKLNYVKSDNTKDGDVYKINGVLGLRANASGVAESDFVKIADVIAEDPATMWAPSINADGNLVLTNRENTTVEVEIKSLRTVGTGVYEAAIQTADGIETGDQVTISVVKTTTATDGFEVYANEDLKNSTFYLGQARRNADGDIPAFWAENHGTHQIGATVKKEEEATKWNVELIKKTKDGFKSETDSVLVDSKLYTYNVTTGAVTETTNTLVVLPYVFQNRGNREYVKFDNRTNLDYYVCDDKNHETPRSAQIFALKKKPGNTVNYMTLATPAESYKDNGAVKAVTSVAVTDKASLKNSASKGAWENIAAYADDANSLMVVEKIFDPEYRKVEAAWGDTVKIYREEYPTEVLFEKRDAKSVVDKDTLSFLNVNNSVTGANPALFVDTAYVNRTVNGVDNTCYQYLLAVNVDPKNSFYCPYNTEHNSQEWRDEHGGPCADAKENVALKGRFLINLVDTAFAYKQDHLHNNPYINMVEADEDLAKLSFVEGVHIKDTLIITRKGGEVVKLRMDTPDFNVAKFAFRYVDYKAGSFKIQTQYKEYGSATQKAFDESASNEGYLRWVNGTVVVTKDYTRGEVFNMEENYAGDPVANENAPEVAGISVIAKDGAVIISGAQGKKVTISNVLGQTVANTVISSDKAEIAAPAGVVVVAVEGEAAVKAIVK